MSRMRWRRLGPPAHAGPVSFIGVNNLAGIHSRDVSSLTHMVLNSQVTPSGLCHSGEWKASGLFVDSGSARHMLQLTVNLNPDLVQAGFELGVLLWYNTFTHDKERKLI